MKAAFIVATATLVIIGLAGCSSDPGPFRSQNGSLPPGTAHLTIDGKAAGPTDSVQCTASKYMTTIRIGADPSAEAIVSSADKLAVDSVRIRGYDGFTGSFDDGIRGDAKVTLTGSTYQISGMAEGFSADHPDPTTRTFGITVAC